MSISKITEGEWEFDEKLQNVMASTEDADQEVAYIADITEIGVQHTIPNGQLIAAAPNLLEACESLLEAIETDETHQVTEVEEIARKAIAKARGVLIETEK